MTAVTRSPMNEQGGETPLGPPAEDKLSLVEKASILTETLPWLETYAGKTVVITGAISDPRSGEKVPRPTFQRLCEKAGATTATSVSANTDYLVTGADVGASKLTKAEKLGVEVVDQGVIWQQLIEAGIA